MAVNAPQQVIGTPGIKSAIPFTGQDIDVILLHMILWIPASAGMETFFFFQVNSNTILRQTPLFHPDENREPVRYY
jgi:hypothetical protein